MQTPDSPGPDMAAISRQLRQPTGDLGRQVAQRMNAGNLAQNQAALQYAELAHANHLLEVGMGNGGLVAGLLSAYPDLQYTGADFSADMVSEASIINVDLVAAARARFVMADIAALPFADASFDRILTVNTIYFWPAPATALQELARVLAPGGLLVIALRTAESMRHFGFAQDVFTLYERPTLDALLDGSPFAGATIHLFAEAMRTSAAGITGPAESYIIVAKKQPTVQMFNL